MSKDKNQIDFHNKNQIDFHNKNQKNNKMIEVPKMQYWDAAKTKPKFFIGVHDNGSLSDLADIGPDGKRHSLSERWYENGQKSSEDKWKDGKKQAVWWHKYAQKMFEGDGCL